MKRTLMLVLLCLVFVPFLGVVAQSAVAPSLETVECPFLVYGDEVEGETLECDVLTVPESREGLSSNTVELMVAVLYSSNPNPAEATLYLEGGPGGSAVNAVMDTWVKSALRQRGDLIIVDQRGTGYSLPSLDCTQFDGLASEQDNPDAVCYEQLLDQGISLNSYNSRENAADIADLVTALGLEQVNLFGVSYGTRLALTVMRDHPEVVRSAIIDGVYPPNVQGYEEQPINGQLSFNQLFADCAASAACTQAFGDLQQLFYSTVDQLNAQPLFVEDENGEEAELNGDAFVNAIFQDLYSTDMIPYLPAKIYAASIGDVEMYNSLGPETTGEEPPPEAADLLADDDSEGMFLAVECYEEVHFNDMTKTQQLSASMPPELYEPLVGGVESQIASCSIWRQARSGAEENQPVVSDIPTLVLSGQYDPITPPSWGAAAAKYLKNSFFFTFPAMGHGSVDVRPCPTDIAMQFLDNPAQKPKADCIAQMPAPDFYIP